VNTSRTKAAPLSPSTPPDTDAADMRHAYHTLANRLAELMDERRDLDHQIDDLQQAVSSLESMLGLDDGDRVSTRSRAQRGTRVSAIEQILDDASGSLTPSQIHEQLDALGRTDTRRDIAAALSYLAANGRAQRTGPGQWASAEAG